MQNLLGRSSGLAACCASTVEERRERKIADWVKREKEETEGVDDGGWSDCGRWRERKTQGKRSARVEIENADEEEKRKKGKKKKKGRRTDRGRRREEGMTVSSRCCGW